MYKFGMFLYMMFVVISIVSVAFAAVGCFAFLMVWLSSGIARVVLCIVVFAAIVAAIVVYD